MSLIINHNLAALQAQRNLSASGAGMTKAIEKLSSGYRINVGADDPSGLIISEQLRSQISGLERAVRNSSEAFNLIGIAEGALNEMNSILKKMRALSIHSANNGITSPEQVAADQAEMDSGIATLNRIANTTRYSDQYLLNGSKELVYDVNTTVNEPTDHAMLDTSLTRVDQIFKRDGVKMSISFTGSRSDWQANTKTSAQRAYLEADSANSLCQVSGTSTTARQEFILTGTQGSRLFSFAEGAHLGTIVDAVNNVRDSTGIGAALIFASDVRIDQSVFGTADGIGPNYTTSTPAAAITGYDDGSYVYRYGDVQIYNAGLNNVETAAIANFTMTPNAATAFKVGFNCDGDGKIYAKVIDKASNSIAYYKDKECTMLIGEGSDDFFAAANNSDIPSSPTQNLDGIFIALSPNARDLDVYEIAVVGQRMDNMKDIDVQGIPGWADSNSAVISGVNLGVNTSSEGEIFYRYTPLTFESDGKTVRSFSVEAFSDSTMEPRFLVATTGEVLSNVNSTSPALGQTVRLESVVMANGRDSNLNITLTLPKPPYDAFDGNATAAQQALPSGGQTGTTGFINLGMRLYAVDYGSAETIRIQNKAGELFYQFREADTMEQVMVKSGTTVQIAGQDASIGLNGAPVITQGLTANTTTPDFSGSLVFNSGSLGLATIAVTGHDTGSLYSRATSLQGVEENEITIQDERRHFEPPSLLLDMGPTFFDKNGNPLSLYLDFGNIAPTVEAAVTPNSPPSADPVTVTYNAATRQLEIDATALGIANILYENVNPSDLASGYFITQPDLKGLFIKTTGVLNTSATGGSTGGTGTGYTAAHNGNVMLEVGTFATNPRKTTTETMSNFVGGMQFQLGNTEGDQDRTVYSIQSMDMANLGRITYDGVDYCLQDVLGGGVASLSRDPIMAMRIISKAVDDVSTLRARLGAFQANTLQTNINSLEVAIENITKTESAIRDTDMAAESTEFTRFQIMQQAGTSMLAQANQVSQNVLSLLQ